METKQILSFLSVAETLNFGRSAKHIHVSQPALSHQMRALEKELGLKLLERNRQGTTLTEAGKAFREEANGVLERLEFAKHKAQWAADGKLGHIRLGFVSTAGYSIVPNLLRQFRKRHPDVEFTIRNLLNDEQLRMIGSESLDIGFLRLPVALRKDINVATIHREPFVAILPDWHPLPVSASVSLKQLKGSPFVLYERERAPEYHDLLLRLLNKAGVIPKVVQSAGEMSTLVSLVDAGVGVSVLPRTAAKRIVSKVRICQITDSLPDAELGIAVARRKPTVVVQRFCDFARSYTDKLIDSHLKK